MNKVEMIQANVDQTMEIQAREAHLVHVILTKRENQPANKKYIDRKFRQCFSVLDFRQMSESGFFKTYDDVHIIHDPNQAQSAKSTDATAAPKKSVKLMNKADLEALYFEKFKKAAPADFVKAQLIEAIEGGKAQPPSDELIILQVEFNKKYGEAAPPDATVEDLKELLK